MPFEQLFPRSFTTSAIREHAPARSGVFGLSNAREWVFIGETDNIQGSLMALLRDTASKQQEITGFVFEVCDRATRSGRLDRLILEFKPTRNGRTQSQ